MTSLGIFKFQESYHRKLLDFDDVEKEVIMILSNMKNGSMPPIRRPLMVLGNEAKEEYESIAGVIYRVNRAKSLELKDRYIHNFECELLPEHPNEPIISRKKPLKKTRSKKTAPKQRCSARRAIAEGNATMALSFDRKEIHTTFSIDAKGEIWKASYAETTLALKEPVKLVEDPYRREYPARQRSRRVARTVSSEPLIQSGHPQAKSKRCVMTQSDKTPSAAAGSDPVQLPTPKITPTALNVGIKTPSNPASPSHGYSCDVIMPNTECPSTLAIPNTGCSSAFNMPIAASSPAVPVKQALQTKTRPGQTYPEMIVRAIKESKNGRLKVSELYEILPVYNPTIISKLNPSEPAKGAKRKSPEEIFQENVRQNLSRNKSLFHNIKDNETGKSTGYWEIVKTAQTAPSSPPSPEASSSSNSVPFSGFKRKLNPKREAGPSKRIKTAE